MQSITKAADELGISRQAVWYGIKHGWIHAERIGYFWAIPDAEIKRLSEPDEIARRQKFMPRKEGAYDNQVTVQGK